MDVAACVGEEIMLIRRVYKTGMRSYAAIPVVAYLLARLQGILLPEVLDARGIFAGGGDAPKDVIPPQVGLERAGRRHLVLFPVALTQLDGRPARHDRVLAVVVGDRQSALRRVRRRHLHSAPDEVRACPEKDRRRLGAPPRRTQRRHALDRRVDRSERGARRPSRRVRALGRGVDVEDDACVGARTVTWA